MKTLIITLSDLFLTGCGTMYKLVEQPDGSYKEVPIMRVRSLARDFDFEETKSKLIGTNIIEITKTRYSSKGTTASVIGASANLMGAVSTLSPF